MWEWQKPDKPGTIMHDAKMYTLMLGIWYGLGHIRCLKPQPNSLPSLHLNGQGLLG